jgi:exonuclease SbcC
MRPLRVEMKGFGPYRDLTEVDFTDVELFALSGPTGAGKSTIIDAICVALYGSVPRYDDDRLIEPVISQGLNEARLRVTFLVDGVEHSATRVIVRTKTGATTKEARLQRGDDVLAGTAAEVKAAVTELLGLTFEHFTRCVVLPQGEFARFLHDKKSERQALLKRLLGIDIYEQIANSARGRAATAAARRDVVAQQLAELADHTAERRDELAARRAALASLTIEVDHHETSVAEWRRRDEADERRRAEIARWLAILGATVAPADLEAVEAEADAAREAMLQAEAMTAAAEGDRAAALAHRAGLGDVNAVRDARAAHLRLEELATVTPEARAAAEAERARVAAAATELRSLEASLAEAASQRDEHERRLESVNRTAEALAAIVAPDDVGRVVASIEAADAALVTAEQADEAARAALSALERAELPDREWLARVEGAVDRVETIDAQIGEIDARLVVARADERAAAAEVERAATELAEAVERAEAAERADRAGVLRHSLEPGEPCPVCEQTVAVVPAPSPRSDVAAADAARRAAESSVATARDRLSERSNAAATLAAQRDHLSGSRADEMAIVGDVTRAVLDASKNRLAEHRAEMLGARTAAEAARAALDRARAARHEVETVREQSARQLDRAIGAVRELDPPAVHDRGLAEAWAALADWAGTERVRRVHARADLEAAIASTVAEEASRRASIADTAGSVGIVPDGALAASAGAHGLAERLAEEVRSIDTRLAEVERLHAHLDRFAASHPLGSAGRAEIEDRLTAIDAAERAVEGANDACREAGASVAAARRRVDDARASTELAERELARRVAELAPLGAPEPASGSLGDRWSSLAAWAQSASLDHEAERTRLDAAAEERAEAEAAAQSRVGAQLAAAAVTVAVGQRASAAVAAAAGVLDKTIADFEQAMERKTELATEVDTLTNDAAVARHLGQLLGAAQFERWLLDDVVRQLVDGATARLRELSGHQYSLDYNDGDFMVIDHRNADQSRPARTLSGGETFLASLSLALSLADQLAAFSTGKAATLEALFLDEGFGTLDPDTLDIVASAVEELGSRGRMIGLVSHVAELAERVPVRFVVTKHANASRVERVLQ